MKTVITSLVFDNNLEPHEINERVFILREAIDGDKFILGTLKHNALEIGIKDVDYILTDVKQELDGVATVIISHRFDIDEVPEITTCEIRPVFLRNIKTGKLCGVSHAYAVPVGLVKTEPCL